uniref:Uncharacterized protein n=1 Tax=Terrapene triunguis TaxID=2587831 RepID=A0A674JWM3_9SAUR
MCTTLLVISTLAILLRRHFFNRVEPYSHPCITGVRSGSGPIHALADAWPLLSNKLFPSLILIIPFWDP